MDKDRPAATIPKPPSGGSSAVRPCAHDYDFLYSSYDMVEGSYRNYYEQKDTFFCRKCLKYETKIGRTANERVRPDWYGR